MKCGFCHLWTKQASGLGWCTNAEEGYPTEPTSPNEDCPYPFPKSQITDLVETSIQLGKEYNRMLDAYHKAREREHAANFNNMIDLLRNTDSHTGEYIWIEEIHSPSPDMPHGGMTVRRGTNMAEEKTPNYTFEGKVEEKLNVVGPISRGDGYFSGYTCGLEEFVSAILPQTNQLRSLVCSVFDEYGKNQDLKQVAEVETTIKLAGKVIAHRKIVVTPKAAE